ncbi:hypothetical protein F5I97DRAFT_1541811 [Phlebopus sp. FC_14]|nr:hypothetical protein F5I97DRAFT_1541811 [Phlebopus sp. FC_14]
MNIHVHPISTPHSAVEVSKVLEAAEINNQALPLSNQRDFAGAEPHHLKGLQMKLAALGEDNATTALTRNVPGELYLKMGILGDADNQLRHAVSVRINRVSVFDAAVSVENLARVYEAKGNLLEGRKTRLTYDHDNIVCGSEECPGQTVTLAKLLACSACNVCACSLHDRPILLGRVLLLNKDWKACHKSLCRDGPLSVEL